MKGMSFLLAAISLLVSNVAFGRSHSYWSSYQAGSENHILVQQSVESDIGYVTYKDKTQSYWKGYGVTTTVGATYRDFIVGTVGYTMLDEHSNSLDEHAWGNSIDGSIKLSFASPIGSLELGGGATGQRLLTSEGDTHASAIGTGLFGSAGMNYLLSYTVSIDAELKVNSVTYHSDAGSSFLDGASSEMYRPSLGLRVRF